MDLLYEIAVRPVVDGIYPLRPPTQEELVEIKTVNQKKAPGKYVPPHLRNKTSSVPGMSAKKTVPGMKYSWMRAFISRAPSKPKKEKPAPKPVSPPPEVLQGPNLMDAIFSSVEQPAETADSIQKKVNYVGDSQ